MIRHDKKDGMYIEIPGVFLSSTGAMADPGTSFKLYVYPANSETAALDGVDFDKVGSEVGFYSYTWDITNVAVGNYYGLQKGVDTATNYGNAINIDITDSRTEVSKLAYLDQYVSKAGSGNGNIKRTAESADSNGDPVRGTQVFLSSSASETDKLTGDLYADSAGITTWWMAAGTYYVFMYKDGQSFPNPTTLVFV